LPNLGEMTLSYDVDGEGPALVLLHSGACDRRMWAPQWPALVDAGYRVVRPDFPGFGETPMPDRPGNEADDVLNLMDALGIDRAALVASSGGGPVAVEIAARRPDRVSALVLLCAMVPGHERTDELRAFGARENALLEAGDVAGAVELNLDTWLGPETGETTREQVRRMQRRAFEVQLAATEEFDPIEHEYDLSTIQAPCLAISGGHDLPDFRQIAARMPGLIGARHVELPWAGHLPSMERPDAVTGLLLEFLGETVTGG
jgi:3-oxoadipate enol-lactonase